MDGVLKNGFRIANTQVTTAATSDTYTIYLDNQKTAADFTTVGLWCERFQANFGQATLKATGASTPLPSSPSPAPSSAPSSTPSAKSGATSMIVSSGAVAGTFVAAAAFAVLMG